jgi:hypothetical protein
MARIRAGLLLAAATFLASGCATLSPDWEDPTVALNSFRALPSDGAVPSFEIGLTIINPNPDPLNLVGIVYTVSLQGHEVVKGVGKDFPVIEGYSQQQITVNASANLFAGLRMFLGMMQESQRGGAPALEYEFEARLDLGGLYPPIRVKEGGNFRMDGSNLVAPAD